MFQRKMIKINIQDIEPSIFRQNNK